MTAANDPTAPPPDNQRAPVPATGDSAAGSISIQAVPPAPATPTVVQETPAGSPRREPMTPARFAAEVRRLDRLLIPVVLVLTFFLASFPARNGDYWMHLATGKLIADGHYTFGADPFAYTTEGTPWINTTWLTDWVAYKLSGSPQDGELPAQDGVPLVVFKAALMTVLAGILLLIRRPGASLWIPAVCVALAVVAMSPRLLLQPSCISFFFLGLTLYLLQRPPSQAAQARPRYRARWLLPVLFALWVNLDSWWILGPLTVGLYLLGEVFQRSLSPGGDQADAPEAGSLASLAGIFVVGLAACVLNPHFFAVNPLHLDGSAVVPTELWGALTDSPLREEAPFHGLFSSPLTSEYWASADYRSIAGMAYFPLLVLGLVSFVLELTSFLLGHGGWRWWRALVWLTFCLLSVYLARAIPFFAVVAGPITALNFQDFLSRQLGTTPRLDPAWKAWSIGGRVVTVVAGLALLAVAWPGWLSPRPDDPRSSRHVGWNVVVDPSLHEAALELRRLRDEGVLTASAHGFNSNPQFADYCAWFCPEEKAFIDYRLALFSDTTAAGYAEVRQALMRPQPQPLDADMEAAPASFGWQDVFRDQHINHVILHHGENRDAWLQVFRPLWYDQKVWTLLYADGRTTIFGWNDPAGAAGADPFRGHALDLDRLAFGPDALRAPSGLQEPPPQPPDVWYEDVALRLDDYFKGPGSHPLAQDQAFMCLGYFEAAEYRTLSSYPGLRFVAATLGMTAAPPCPGAPWVQSPLALGLLQRMRHLDMLRHHALGPPAAPLLAVRYARRAIADNPRSADAYVQLAHAYHQMSQKVEMRWSPVARDLEDVRRVQTIAALRSALTLDPELKQARGLLASIYHEQGYADLEVEQFQRLFEQIRATGPDPRVSEADFNKQVEDLEREIDRKEKDLDQRRRDYELRAQNKSPSQKVELAMKNGLGQQALDVLTEADPNLLRRAEVQTKLNLLLITGRVAEAADPAVRQTDFDSFQVDAVLGAYGEADEALDHLIRESQQQSAALMLGLHREFTLQAAMNLGRLARVTYEVAREVRSQANMTTYRGLMALEQGDTAAATRYFQTVVDLAGPRTGGGKGSVDVPSEFDFENRAIAVHYLELLRAAGS